jgi:hypothetical protein
MRQRQVARLSVDAAAEPLRHRGEVPFHLRQSWSACPDHTGNDYGDVARLRDGVETLSSFNYTGNGLLSGLHGCEAVFNTRGRTLSYAWSAYSCTQPPSATAQTELEWLLLPIAEQTD